ncbi:hypothetical protein WG66_006743 [Moniliophthora roreri]|nr:hypothetical protein WG66_006743 [Moniliophthora roreri]
MQTEKYKLKKTAFSQNEDQSSPDVTDGRESKCCPACKADVYTSRNLIHGPSEEVYNQYARSNSYPTGSDTFKEEFEAAKINLDRLTATIALLEAERARLKGIVEKYSAILHPLRAMSPEALQSIFQSCVECSEQEEPRPKSSLVPSGMPWVLGQVCRYWRNLALSTSHLWTSVVLDIRVQSHDRKTQPISSQTLLLGLQTYRSQNLPLTVTIYCERLKDYSNHPLMVLICARSQQWRSLRIEGHADMLRGPMSSVRGLLPSLESMSIDLTDGGSYSRPDEMELAPALRALTLHGFTSIRLPWHQIKYFQLRSSRERSKLVSTAYTDRVMTTLNQLSDVEVCDLHFDNEIESNLYTSLSLFQARHLNCNHLTSLTISASSWCSAPNFIRRITAPKLNSLKITTPFSGWDQLLWLISRSSCKLTELSIRAAERDSCNEYVLNVFSSVRDLTFLELGFRDTLIPGQGEELISLLSSPVLPRLEKLSIIQSSSSRSPYSDGVLLNALEYRWNPPEGSGVNRLRVVTLGMKVIDPASRRRLEALRAEGLVVVEKDN